jgi:Predicted membrane protein (DUF2339)
MISLCIGLFVASILDWGLFWLWLWVFWPILVIGVKYLFFSPDYIKTRLEYFQEKLLQSPWVPLSTQKSSSESRKPQNENSFTEVMQEQQEDRNLSHSLKLSQEETSKTLEIPREPGMIERFFSENLLAKLWGILVFLGVLFLLSLVYTLIGPVAKMIVGFAIGFFLLLTGVFLDKRGYSKEAHILMGTAFLVNYLVILSGRYLLGTPDLGVSAFLSVATTFFFLILNTLLATITSLVYKSRILLLFSFLFAYINPLLLGTSSTEPYTLLGYTMIVTLGALFLSYREKDKLLFSLSFLFASFFFLAAPWSNATEWITKLLCINTLGALSLYVSSVFEKKYQYLSELLIGGTFFLIGFMWLLGVASLSVLQLSILSASSLGVMMFCYISMSRGAYLYSIGTLWTVLSLSPALLVSGVQETHLIISMLTLSVFLLLNIGVLLVKEKETLSNNLWNIIGWLISGAIFMTYMIYTFGNMYFPWMLQGFAYMWLAIVYSSLAFFFVSKIWFETIRTQEKYQNMFYTIAALWISFFSLAIAFVLSEYKEIVSIVWLLEANVLFFLTQKTKSLKIGVAALVLYIVGIGRLIPFLGALFWGTSGTDNYGFWVALLLAFGSLIFNLYFIFPKIQETFKSYLPTEFYGAHNFFHIAGVFVVSILGENILDIQNNWYTLLYFASLLTVLGYIYHSIRSFWLQTVYLLFYVLLLFTHLGFFVDAIGFGNDHIRVSTLVTLVLSTSHIYKYLSKTSPSGDIQMSVFLVYLFLLSTFYVSHIFAITFAITLYWGILSFLLLSYGIKKDIIALRTVWLYLIVLTAGKVFFYDIWMSVDNVFSRVVALIVVGILMIILSTMYTRKYGNRLNKEFNPENLFPKIWESQKDAPKKELTSRKQEIQENLWKISTGGIIGVRMYITGTEKPIQIRTENLVKIAKLIETATGKTNFLPGELKEIYDDFSVNYKSSLSVEQYKKIKDIVASFVKNGGKMEFVSK